MIFLTIFFKEFFMVLKAMKNSLKKSCQKKTFLSKKFSEVWKFSKVPKFGYFPKVL